jgi:iron complex transport system ATP-binding protein
VSRLKIDSLTVAYDRHIALQDVSLSVNPGEVQALIGPNGAGKSTLIRAVSGLLSPRSGRIMANGADLTALSIVERARLLSVVPQASHFGGAFTVRQAVLMGRTAYMNWLGNPSDEDVQTVELAMEQTSVDGLADRHIAELSGGEQQRVLLARALAQSTPILLLDEPTNHLDLQHQIGLLELVARLAREKELAVLMAMHDLNLVSSYADKVALLVGGRLVGNDTPARLLTAETISQAYGTPIQVIPHPQDGIPLILPDRRA